MINSLGLRARLTVIFGTITLGTLVVLGGSTCLLSSVALNKEVLNELKSVTLGVANTADIAYEINQEMVEQNVGRVYHALGEHAAVAQEGNSHVMISNQVSGELSEIDLPKMKINGEALLYNYGAVDSIAHDLGAAVTVFQVIPQGLLRITTTIKDKEGKRAVGTYIPTDSPVYQAVMKGTLFIGRAFVVDEWYITAYKPVYNEAHEIIGAVFAGIKQTSLALLRTKVLSLKVGETGYAFIIDTTGRAVIHPSSEGQNIGNLPHIKEMIDKKNGVIRYIQQTKGSGSHRKKIVAYRYIPSMEWIVACGSYEDEFMAMIYRQQRVTCAIIITATILTILLIMLVALSISRPINTISANLYSSARQVEDAAYQTSQSGQSLSSEAEEFSAATGKIMYHVELLKQQTDVNVQSVAEAKALVEDTLDEADQNTHNVELLGHSIEEISENSSKVTSIMKLIDDIAFQTNILALNAAVEAARAGESGKSFAVVADQVKILAQRCSEAVKKTDELTESIAMSIKKGGEISEKVAVLVKHSHEKMIKIDTYMDGISLGSKEQSANSVLIAKNIEEINGLVEQTAAFAEENASAGEELSSHSSMLKEIVLSMNVLLIGKKRTALPV